MSVKHIFLALLSKKPMHGYELKESFEEIIANQGSLNFGQVYTTLSRLERDNLVSKEEIQQIEKPDKKIYHITDKGRDEFAKWFNNNPKWSIYFDELSFKISVFDIVDNLCSKDLLIQYKQYLLGLLKKLMNLRESNESKNQQLILERNILKVEADLKWIDICIENVNA